MNARASIAPLAVAGAAGLGALFLLRSRPRPTRVTPPVLPNPFPNPNPFPAPPVGPPSPPVPPPYDPPPPGSLEAIDAQLEAAGVRDFTARELLRLPKAKPPRVDLPPAKYIPNLIKLGQLLQVFRDRLGHRVNIASGWRPPWYNEAVGGAEDSAHIRGAAADAILPADLSNPQAIDRFRLTAAAVWKASPDAAGLGFYAHSPRRVHFDVLHPGGHGRRIWDRELVQSYLDRLVTT